MVEIRPDATPRARRPAVIAAFTAGWLVLAAATAGAVVAVGRSSEGTSPGSPSAAALPTAGSSAASTSGTPSPSSSSVSATPTTSAAPPTTPKPPVSTVTGKVGPGLVHSGDIRFFLMPVPPDAGVIGDAAGKPLTKDEVAARYSNSAEALKELNQLGYKDGAYRDYQTGDAKYHVVARLWHFTSAQSAKIWVQGDQPDPADKSFSVSGFPDLRAWYLSPVLSGDPASLRGMGVCGDVAFEIFVIGQEPLDRGLLGDRVRKQVDRLTKGA